MVYEHFKSDLPISLFSCIRFSVVIVYVILICPRGVTLKMYIDNHYFFLYCSRTPVGLEDVSKYPQLFKVLRDRGWSDEDLQKLMGNNLLRVLRKAEEVWLHYKVIVYAYRTVQYQTITIARLILRAFSASFQRLFMIALS